MRPIGKLEARIYRHPLAVWTFSFFCYAALRLIMSLTAFHTEYVRQLLRNPYGQLKDFDEYR